MATMNNIDIEQAVNGTGYFSFASLLPPDIAPSELEACFQTYKPGIPILMSSEFVAALTGFFGKRTHWPIVEQYLKDTKIAPENVKILRRAVAEHIENTQARIIDTVEYADELQRKKPDPIKYQHNRIMPLTGLIVLAGRPKLGKSYLALNLSIAIATKGKFASYFDMAYPGAVLYMALEDNRERMYSRMEALCGPQSSWPENLGFVYKGPRMDNGRLVQELSQWVESVDIPRLIVVDIFARVRSRARSNADLYQADYDEVTELSDFAMAHGVSVIIVTHLNKNYADVDSAMDAVMGTTGITGGVSAGYVMSWAGMDGVDATLSISGKDVPSWTLALERIALDGHIDWKALGDFDQIGQSDSRKEVLQTLYTWDGQGPKPSELRETLGRSKNTFNKLVVRMRTDGLIKLDKGRLFLTDTGRETAEFLRD
jgi:hypothetical protein